MEFTMLKVLQANNEGMGLIAMIKEVSKIHQDAKMSDFTSALNNLVDRGLVVETDRQEYQVKQA